MQRPFWTTTWALDDLQLRGAVRSGLDPHLPVHAELSGDQLDGTALASSCDGLDVDRIGKLQAVLGRARDGWIFVVSTSPHRELDIDALQLDHLRVRDEAKRIKRGLPHEDAL